MFTRICTSTDMYPLEQQPKYKDIVVIDDIVFTSSCNCDWSNQHKEMFPHYRATCAIGLICPSRLNKIKKILYASDRNAPSEKFTTARSMLVDIGEFSRNIDKALVFELFYI